MCDNSFSRQLVRCRLIAGDMYSTLASTVSTYKDIFISILTLIPWSVMLSGSWFCGSDDPELRGNRVKL